MNLLTICLAAYSLLVTIVAVSAIREVNRLSEGKADADL